MRSRSQHQLGSSRKQWLLASCLALLFATIAGQPAMELPAGQASPSPPKSIAEEAREATLNFHTGGHSPTPNPTVSAAVDPQPEESTSSPGRAEAPAPAPELQEQLVNLSELAALPPAPVPAPEQGMAHPPAIAPAPAPQEPAQLDQQEQDSPAPAPVAAEEEGPVEAEAPAPAPVAPEVVVVPEQVLPATPVIGQSPSSTLVSSTTKSNTAAAVASSLDSAPMPPTQPSAGSAGSAGIATGSGGRSWLYAFGALAGLALVGFASAYIMRRRRDNSRYEGLKDTEMAMLRRDV